MKHDFLLPTLQDAEFTERFVQLHRQLWRSPMCGFDDVTTHIFRPPAGFYQVDHSFMHDGENWHVYYISGELRLCDAWSACVRAGDLEGANKVCVEPGNGHAVGASLFDLEFVENVWIEPQGRFDLLSRGCCSLFRYRDRYGMLYDVRGDRGELMSLAWSDDLCRWDRDGRNPVLSAPTWANPSGSFKDPHVMEYQGVYLIYLVAWTQTGQPCIALFSTEDWEHFEDHGPVFSAAPMMRGTFGIESPQVILRDGLWHLFYTHGSGLWHAVSPSPVDFQMRGAVDSWTRPLPGAYLVGPYHATEIIQDGDDWYMTTDRKEHQRNQNRLARRELYRGEYEDEQPLEEGMYLTRVQWDNDQPVMVKPARPDSRE